MSDCFRRRFMVGPKPLSKKKRSTGGSLTMLGQKNEWRLKFTLTDAIAAGRKREALDQISWRPDGLKIFTTATPYGYRNCHRETTRPECTQFTAAMTAGDL